MGHDKVAEVLVRAGADVNAVYRVKIRFPVCTLRCTGQSVDDVSIIVGNVAFIAHSSSTSVTCACELQDGHTLLHFAVTSGKDKLAGVLVRAGADVNATDKVRARFFWQRPGG